MGSLNISGAAILLILRNGLANDWSNLCKIVCIDPSEMHTAQNDLAHRLRNLRAEGFIEYKDTTPAWGSPPIEGLISVTGLWGRIQEALGVGLSSIADLKPVGYLLTNPFFGSPKEIDKDLDVFVLMPFSSEMQPVYEDHITNVCSRLNLSVARADDFFSASVIISHIWNSINAAKVIVADCTGLNPNVFYELGISHTLGKPTILITQNRTEAPFDVRHVYRIIYDFTPRGMKDFEQRLEESLGFAMKSAGGAPLVMPWEWGRDRYI
jgi:hypothetical protein